MDLAEIIMRNPTAHGWREPLDIEWADSPDTPRVTIRCTCRKAKWQVTLPIDYPLPIRCAYCGAIYHANPLKSS